MISIDLNSLARVPDGAQRDDRGDDQGDDGHNVDEDVHRRTRGVLQWVADGVTNDGGAVTFGTFATAVTFFNILLRIVPGTAGVTHHQCENDAAQQRADEQTAKRLGTEQEADEDRRTDCECGRQDHFLERGLRCDIDTALGVRLGVALKQAGDLFELSTDLRDHLVCCGADRLHRDRAGEERQQAAEEDADEDRRVIDGQVHRFREVLVRNGDERGDHGQRGEPCGTNCKTLADGGGRVAHRVKAVGDLAGGVGHFSHLRDAAGVVGDRAIGVDGHGDAHGGEHADRSDTDTV